MNQGNPFKDGSTQHHDYEVLSDLNWHCSKCELKAGQAKTWQTWRDAYGIQFEEPSPRRWEKRIHCDTCKKTTVHRKLASLERQATTSARAGMSLKTAQRVKKLLNNEEAVFLRQLSSNELEVDHKFPQIRWNKDEDVNDNASDEYLIAKFILLNRSNNLLKSRNCERCYRDGKRGSFPGIYYWYSGTEEWQGDPHDENGCVGCFWYDPYEWRKNLNELIETSQNT